MVSYLAERIATQVEVGLDFCLALGQDCEKNVFKVQTDFESAQSPAENIEHEDQWPISADDDDDNNVDDV